MADDTTYKILDVLSKEATAESYIYADSDGVIQMSGKGKQMFGILFAMIQFYAEKSGNTIEDLLTYLAQVALDMEKYHPYELTYKTSYKPFNDSCSLESLTEMNEALLMIEAERYKKEKLNKENTSKKSDPQVIQFPRRQSND